MIIHRKKKFKKGHGLINKVINKLPFELHLPGYNYCGPGTKLSARLARGDKPINPLDAACKEHDIAYSQNRENISARNVADRELASKAWQRVFSKDSSLGEKAAAYAVTNTMNLKSKLGMGLKRKKGSKKRLKRRVKKT